MTLGETAVDTNSCLSIGCINPLLDFFTLQIGQHSKHISVHQQFNSLMSKRQCMSLQHVSCQCASHHCVLNICVLNIYALRLSGLLLICVLLQAVNLEVQDAFSAGGTANMAATVKPNVAMRTDGNKSSAEIAADGRLWGTASRGPLPGAQIPQTSEAISAMQQQPSLHVPVGQQMMGNAIELSGGSIANSIPTASIATRSPNSTDVDAAMQQLPALQMPHMQQHMGFNPHVMTTNDGTAQLIAAASSHNSVEASERLQHRSALQMPGDKSLHALLLAQLKSESPGTAGSAASAATGLLWDAANASAATGHLSDAIRASAATGHFQDAACPFSPQGTASGGSAFNPYGFGPDSTSVLHSSPSAAATEAGSALHASAAAASTAQGNSSWHTKPASNTSAAEPKTDVTASTRVASQSEQTASKSDLLSAATAGNEMLNGTEKHIYDYGQANGGVGGSLKADSNVMMESDGGSENIATGLRHWTQLQQCSLASCRLCSAESSAVLRPMLMTPHSRKGMLVQVQMRLLVALH